MTLLIPSAEYFKFFTPFFGIGLVLRKFGLFEKRLNKPVFGGLMAMSIFLLYMWKPDYAIYKTGNPSLYDYETDRVVAWILRVITGTSFTVFLVQLFWYIRINAAIVKWLTNLSFNSLGIYVIHFLIFSNFVSPLLSGLYEVQVDIVSLLLTFIMVPMLNILIKLLRKKRIICLLTLGEIKNSSASNLPEIV